MSGGWQGSDRRRRLPKGWDKLRLQILRRDGHQCCWTENGRRCTAAATDVDHIEAGDNHHPANLQSLCRRHHNRKTAAEAAAARARFTTRRPDAPHPGLLPRPPEEPRR